MDFGPRKPYVPPGFMHRKLFGAWGGPGPQHVGIGELGRWSGLGQADDARANRARTPPDSGRLKQKCLHSSYIVVCSLKTIT